MQAPLLPRIRPMTREDCEAVARLCGELGYPASAGQICSRLASAMPETRARLVAEADNGSEGFAVVGWIEVRLAEQLTSERSAEICGMVVAEEFRSRSIGRLLVSAAEDWASSQGVASLLVRSRISRDRAHRFYRRCGFEQVKTSLIFQKPL